eukprot:150640-Pelagomonas_calceolata.AAC.2
MQELSGWAPKEFTEGEDAEANGEEQQQQQQQQQQEAGSTAAAAGTSAASASSSQPSGTSGYIYDETSGYYYDPGAQKKALQYLPSSSEAGELFAEGGAARIS